MPSPPGVDPDVGTDDPQTGRLGLPADSDAPVGFLCSGDDCPVSPTFPIVSPMPGGGGVVDTDPEVGDVGVGVEDTGADIGDVAVGVGSERRCAHVQDTLRDRAPEFFEILTEVVQSVRHHRMHEPPPPRPPLVHPAPARAPSRAWARGDGRLLRALRCSGNSGSIYMNRNVVHSAAPGAGASASAVAPWRVRLWRSDVL